MITGADIVLTSGGYLNDEMIRSAPSLKWIHSLLAGLDWLAKLPSLAEDVLVTSTGGIHGPPVSELTLLLMLAMARGLPVFLRNQPEGIWFRPAGGLIFEKTVGILGVGAIATDLAPKLSALGANIIGISSDAGRDVPGITEMRRSDKLAAAVADLDFLVLLTPHRPATHHIVDAEVFAAMKPSAFLVNVARGGVVDEDALLMALREGQIAGAGLDAFQREPLPADHPFWQMENVIVTPHTAGLSDRYAIDAMPVVENNLRAFQAGEISKMINIVDRTLLSV